jgi:SWI/SNF-related matrix-associated actin-dependent regulator of chromatin subfamily A-like protein 1
VQPDLILEQWEGAAALAAHSVFMLADRVGFGKSAQFVRACDMVSPDPATRIIVVCPPNLRRNEAAEFARWGVWPRPVTFLETGRDPLPDGGVVVVSYNLASRREVRDRLAAWRPIVLICDEAHALKDPASSRCRAILEPGAGLAHAARHVWFITGTPTPNHSGELFPFAKLCGAWTGSYPGFQSKFCNTTTVWRNGTPIGTRIVGSKNHAELVALVQPFVLAREAVESERPPLEIDDFACEGREPDFDGVDPRELEAISEAVASGDFEQLRELAPEAVATVRRVVGLCKAESVAQLALDELTADPSLKTLIFCEHTAVIDLIAAKLSPIGCGIVDGRTPNRDRPELFASFEPGKSGPLRALVCHRLSASEGLTLTQSTRVILAEPAWTPDANKQTIARAWRRGQRRPVRATYCYLAGSIDAAVTATLRRKAQDTAKLAFS